MHPSTNSRLARWVMLRVLHRHSSNDTRASALGAYGSKSTKGTGASLIGSRGRGALTKEQLEALERGEFVADDELEAGDVLMEVLAEDHRLKRNRNLEFAEGGFDADEEVDDDDGPKLTNGPRVAHRRYLTAPGVGPGTAFQRQQAAQRQRLETAEANAFDYQLPAAVKRQREHERRSRAKLREHDVIENRIQEAMADGAFDNLPGAGKPLSREENVFEQMSGDAMAHRILKNAGIAPGWVEQRKEIRGALARARAELAIEWAACVPVWPLPPPIEDSEDAHRSPMTTAGMRAEAHTDAPTPTPAPGSASGGWRVYHAPAEVVQRGVQSPTPHEMGATAEAAEPAAPNETAAPNELEASNELAASNEPAVADEALELSEEERRRRESVAAAAERARTAEVVRLAAASGPQPAHWAASVVHFEDEIRKVNKMIDTYNLSVPASWQQIHKLQPAAEVTRALHEAPERVKELKAERRSQRAEAVPTKPGEADALAARAALLGGVPPTFAVSSAPTFPNLFDALASALFSR